MCVLKGVLGRRKAGCEKNARIVARYYVGVCRRKDPSEMCRVLNSPRFFSYLFRTSIFHLSRLLQFANYKFLRPDIFPNRNFPNIPECSFDSDQITQTYPKLGNIFRFQLGISFLSQLNDKIIGKYWKFYSYLNYEKTLEIH